MFRIALRPLVEHSISRIFRMALFWHFLDFVWIFIFTVVYGMEHLQMNCKATFCMRTAIPFVGSVILTLAAYFIIVQPDYFHLEIKTALIIIFVLKSFSSWFVFFFSQYLERKKERYWNFGVFVFFRSPLSSSLFFSLWIINHLNYNMGINQPPLFHSCKRGTFMSLCRDFTLDVKIFSIFLTLTHSESMNDGNAKGTAFSHIMAHRFF